VVQQPARDGSYGAGTWLSFFKSGAFFDRYLAQMANNGGVYTEP
jgi:hypothetical protein